MLCISTIDYPSVIEAAISKVPEDVSEASNHDILRRQLRKQILYLQKPIKVNELDEMLDHAQSLKAETVPTIELRGEKDTLYAHEDEILYAIKNGNYLHVVLSEGRSLDLLSTLPNFYSQLAMFSHFVIISEHCFVNAAYIEKLSLLRLKMKDGQCFNVSPLELARVKKALKKSSADALDS